MRAEIPTATGGLEVMVETRRVVRDRNRVTRRPILPGTTWVIRRLKCLILIELFTCGLMRKEVHEMKVQRELGR